MTPQQAIALIEKNDLKAVCEAFGRADTVWHEKEWKEFVEAIRKDERERIRKEVMGLATVDVTILSKE